MEFNPAQQSMLELLRGAPEDRSTFDPACRDDLQRELDEALAHIGKPLKLAKHPLSQIHQCEGKFVADDPFAWTTRNARGTIAHKAFELSVGGAKRVTPSALFDMTLNTICSGSDNPYLVAFIHEMDDGQRAELRVAVVDLIIKYFEMFPHIPDAWIPHAEATTAVTINRKIVLRGKIDLKLGSPQGNKAASLIIDFKTGAPSFTDHEDLRFYALIETLRTGTPPFKVASVYLDAGRADEEPVTEAILRSAARRVIDGVKKIDELRNGRQPVLNPGFACKFCSVNETCEEVFVDYEPIHSLT